MAQELTEAWPELGHRWFVRNLRYKGWLSSGSVRARAFKPSDAERVEGRGISVTACCLLGVEESVCTPTEAEQYLDAVSLPDSRQGICLINTNLEEFESELPQIQFEHQPTDFPYGSLHHGLLQTDAPDRCPDTSVIQVLVNFANQNPVVLPAV